MAKRQSKLSDNPMENDRDINITNESNKNSDISDLYELLQPISKGKFGLVRNFVVLIFPLSINDIMQSEHVVILGHDSRTHPSKLLHVSTSPQQQPNVNTHRSHVGACLATHPKNTQLLVGVILDQLALINGSDPQFPLYCGNATKLRNNINPYIYNK